MNLENILKDVKEIAREAGEIQKKHFRGKNISMCIKSSKVDLVTKVDKASEYLIIKKLSEKYDFSFLSEEKGKIDNKSEYKWIIDPLDGTTNFASGFPIFAVSIALTKGDKTLLGCVYVPMLDEMYTAIKDKKAYLGDSELRIGKKAKLNQSILATGFPYDKVENKDNNSNYFAHMVPKVRGLRRAGAAAYDLVNVASGVFDGFWEINLSKWDIAAGKLIIQEAGGIVKDMENKRGESIIAGNRSLVKLIENELKEVDKCD